MEDTQSEMLRNEAEKDVEDAFYDVISANLEFFTYWNQYKFYEITDVRTFQTNVRCTHLRSFENSKKVVSSVQNISGRD